MQDALKQSSTSTRKSVVVEYTSKWDSIKTGLDIFKDHVDSGKYLQEYQPKAEYMGEVIRSSKIKLAIALGEIPAESFATELVEWQPEKV